MCFHWISLGSLISLGLTSCACSLWVQLLLSSDCGYTLDYWRCEPAPCHHFVDTGGSLMAPEYPPLPGPSPPKLRDTFTHSPLELGTSTSSLKVMWAAVARDHGSPPAKLAPADWSFGSTSILSFLVALSKSIMPQFPPLRLQQSPRPHSQTPGQVPLRDRSEVIPMMGGQGRGPPFSPVFLSSTFCPWDTLFPWTVGWRVSRPFNDLTIYHAGIRPRC